MVNANPSLVVGPLGQLGAVDLDVLLALAAILLGLSLAIQVIQELWKHVTTSKAKAYRRPSIDSVGKEIDENRKERTLAPGGDEALSAPLWSAQPVGKQTKIQAVWARVRCAVRPGNLLACLATASPLAFGAPFWHRPGKALLSTGGRTAGTGTTADLGAA